MYLRQCAVISPVNGNEISRIYGQTKIVTWIVCRIGYLFDETEAYKSE